MCTAMGGGVRVANNIVIPNADSISFMGDDNINGFLGYMLTRTPLGKRHKDDDANYWTIVIEAANFAGPVMYMSSWFWDSRTAWHPKSKSWAHPEATLGYIAEGFEGRIGGYRENDGTWKA